MEVPKGEFNMKNHARNQKIIYMVELAMLIALIIVLQLIGGSIPLGMIPLTFSLIPIVIGAIVLGPIGGGILGFVFGVITIIMTPMNAILMTLFQANPVCYILVAISKATLSGFGAGWVYKVLNKLLKERFKYFSTVIASISVPIINTGIFVLGMFLFFSGTLSSFPAMYPSFFGTMNGYFQVVIIGLVGFNFVGEFIVNLVLSPAIARIVDVIGKRVKK